MAPNKRGGGLSTPTSVISKEEIEQRGSGTKEHGDTYTFSFRGELRVFLTGRCERDGGKRIARRIGRLERAFAGDTAPIAAGNAAKCIGF